MHAAAALHETPVTRFDNGVGESVLWISQRLPVKRSTRVMSTDVRMLLVAVPTAVHPAEAEHEIPARLLADGPTGSGVCWIAQPVELHRSASAALVDDVAGPPG